MAWGGVSWRRSWRGAAPTASTASPSMPRRTAVHCMSCTASGQPTRCAESSSQQYPHTHAQMARGGDGMVERQRVNIGIVGTGFIAETRARSYAGVTGYDARIVAVASRGQDRAQAYAARFGVPDVL